MLFWHKTTKNKKRELEEDLLQADLPTVLSDIEQEPDIKSGFQFSALLPEAAASLQSGCNYPLNIQNQFPVWSKIKDDETQPNLPDIVSEYYNWLTCATKSNITPEYGFFELENLKNINNLSKDFLILHSEIYIPSLPPDALNADVSQEELKNLLNGIYTKLYSYKGSEKSFKYLISHFFNLNSNNVYIIHPKKYLMVLNDKFQ